jgi:hypothetical protein
LTAKYKLHAKEYERPEFHEMINTTLRLMNELGISPQECSSRIYVSPGIDWTQNMIVIPVHFAKEHKKMLTHSKEESRVYPRYDTIAISPRFVKLITSLRTAVEKGEGTLDKDATSYDDILDEFRLSLQLLLIT